MRERETLYETYHGVFISIQVILNGLTAAFELASNF